MHLIVLPRYTFAVLACLPGAIGLVSLIWEKRSFKKVSQQIKKVADAKKTKATSKGASARRRSPRFNEDVSEQEPSGWNRVFSATCLTVVFAVVAAAGGDGGSDLGVRWWKQHQPAATAQSQAPKANEKPKAPEASGQTAPAVSGAPASVPPLISGMAGLVYAGYGAYVYTLLLTISRLNSKAVTSVFFMVGAVRSAIALVLGFAAADINLFAGLGDHQELFVLFFVGLFPSLAMDALRRRAQQFFKPAVPGCESLPLCLIDGIDDGIADRLAETGIWDIQHIATADVYKLTAQTLYPLRRIADWMDQALLINYVRGNVVHFRACGLRGAMDFSALYRDATGGKPTAKPAEPETSEADSGGTGITGAGTAGSGTGGSGTSGSGAAGSGVEGAGVAGSGTGGSGTGGSGAAGSGTAGSGTGGSGAAGSGTAGSGTAGSSTGGSGAAASGTAGSGTAGSGTGGSVAAGSGTAGSGTAGSGTGGSVAAGSGTGGSDTGGSGATGGAGSGAGTAGAPPGASTTGSTEPTTTRLEKTATQLIQVLAQKTSIQEPALYTIGRNLFEDAVVNFIWDLWFDDQDRVSGNAQDDQQPSAGTGSASGSSGSPGTGGTGTPGAGGTGTPGTTPAKPPGGQS